ncbi:helix-turn-helix transcriptional regulator [Pseudomonas aeruginosa]|uniref:helix-turn-helix transcriptional regulator n=1 Tax=Pseudomonas aeruginosa TaxID=287 RepID=UPI002042EB1F|nr:helix-turn-helix domain-containing protein [Pseudomonas aeruginosa]MCM3889465.1 helix-turn-helix domain-containing protein [Pseudomonas aeruginosa]MCM3940202.1 helix-turn-helix domain-containing protein [Pseudomonas aeruginosa]MCM3951078.1 helix-turn-helix domain-containing protein [Pseudomonas aeruginosa]MCM3958243.1 helix-turn-helix domain-containing protein [Pseudomonas aeruginosa]MCM3964361.1 helix-turn-helix domain-containing protein [Pseudomonas aeruginosa]
MSEQFLSEVDLAARWAMSSKTLTRWRTIRRGPPFVKLGKTVRYAMSDVLEFERNGLRKPTPKAAPEMVVPEELGPQLTVRDVVVSLSLGGCDGGAIAQAAPAAL